MRRHDHRPTARLSILMGTLNGSGFLSEQLQSIAEQGGVRWDLTVSDDGSRDDTLALVRMFADQHPGRVRIVAGPGGGFAANYLSMLAALPPAPGPVALSDQDDVWFPGRLCRALDMLGVCGEGPVLYCADRLLWAQDRDVARPERRGAVRPSFRNALIENIAGGNTIVLNPAAARLARAAAPKAGGVFAHDWWLYQLISGVGGQVIFDPEPALLYRQHAGNALGAGLGVQAWIARKTGVLRGDFRAKVDRQVAALDAAASLLTAESRFVLSRFRAARRLPASERVRALRGLDLYRQTRCATLGFWGAVALGRA